MFFFSHFFIFSIMAAPLLWRRRPFHFNILFTIWFRLKTCKTQRDSSIDLSDLHTIFSSAFFIINFFFCQRFILSHWKHTNISMCFSHWQMNIVFFLIFIFIYKPFMCVHLLLCLCIILGFADQISKKCTNIIIQEIQKRKTEKNSTSFD